MTNLIAQKLADVLRIQLKYHPEHTIEMCRTALGEFDFAKDVPDTRDAEIEELRDDIECLEDYRELDCKELRAKDAEIAALKAAQPDLQPLHDLVINWRADGGYRNANAAKELEVAIKKLQSAGEVKP